MLHMCLNILFQLRNLDVSHNPSLGILPDFMVNMSSLVLLDARHCNIIHFSVTVGQWPRLNSLQLDGVNGCFDCFMQ